MTEDAVAATLDDDARAYCAKDIHRLMAVTDTRDDISVIGTGADEFRIRPNQVRQLFLRNLGEVQANRFEWQWSHTVIASDDAPVAVRLTIRLDVAGKPSQIAARWTDVLRHVDGRWVWLHRHASAAASRQREGTPIPTANSRLWPNIGRPWDSEAGLMVRSGCACREATAPASLTG